MFVVLQFGAKFCSIAVHFPWVRDVADKSSLQEVLLLSSHSHVTIACDAHMFRALVLALVLVLCLQTSFAQDQGFNPDSLLQNVLEGLEGTQLSLREAIDHAAAKSTSVRIAEAAYLAARGAARREAGVFDPELFFSLHRFEDERPATSIFELLFTPAPVFSTKQTFASGGLRVELPIGTSVEASINTERFERSTTSDPWNPKYTATGSLSFRQPLLRGFLISARKQASKADSEMEAAKARYDQELLATSSVVEQRYWDLYAAERDYAVQKVTRDRAEAFLKETELRARIGLVGPNQVATARTFLAEQEILLLDREEQLDRVSEQLAALMGGRPPQNSNRFVTVDNPSEDFTIGEIDVLVEQAKERNLSLQAGKADIEARRSLSNAAFWEMLPDVNLVGSIGGTGFGGVGVPQRIRFGTIDTLIQFPDKSLGDAVNQATKRDFPNWSVGVEVSIPLLLRSGRGERDRLEAEVIIAEQRYISEQRLLEEQVRTTYRELAHGKRRLEAAREGVHAAQEQVRIGLIEFQNGRSTAFELVRLGADFAIAQQRYSQALVRGAKAAATLRQLTSGAYGGGVNE